MKRLASFIPVLLLSVLALPAHATSNPDAAVNSINSAFRTSTVSPKAVGGGGGTTPGGGVGEICNASPENGTMLLALLSGAGLLVGSRMRRMRVARVAIS